MTPLYYDDEMMKHTYQIMSRTLKPPVHDRIYIIRLFSVEICKFLVHLRFNVNGVKDDRLTMKISRMINMIQDIITFFKASAPSDGVHSEEMFYLSSAIDRLAILVSIEEGQNLFVRVFKIIRDSIH